MSLRVDGKRMMAGAYVIGPNREVTIRRVHLAKSGEAGKMMVSYTDIISGKKELRAHNAHHRFDDICKEYQRTVKRYAVNGNKIIDLDIEPHFVLGGILINKRGETKVNNIYALGECSYGMHGKGRLGGGSIGEILVMSRVVAQQILK